MVRVSYVALAVHVSAAFLACRHVNQNAEVQSGGVAAAAAPPLLTQPSSFDCSVLDYGVYWYGIGNTAQKAVAGVSSPLYDPRRPTILYAHGWQPGSVQHRQREDLQFLDPDTNNTLHLADAWLAAGWNVGILYWNQFADEDDVRDAEVKIWGLADPTTQPVGMRWRQCDGSFSSVDAPRVSVADALYHSYRAALAAYQGTNIRLVGHSLGNQVVTRLAALIAAGVAQGEVAPNLLPRRVALVDPWWSMAPILPLPPPTTPPTVPPLTTWHGPDAFRLIQQLVAEGMLFERYQTSDILAAAHGDPNTPLTQLIGLTVQVPAFITATEPSVEIGNRHVVAPRLYLLDFSYPPPIGCHDSVCDQQVPSSATSDEQLRQAMAAPVTWRQVEGVKTATPVDDRYNKEQR